MFQSINRWFFRKSIRIFLKPKPKKHLGSKGQIAIILLIMIGILLMLVAVAMNLGRISMSQVNLQIATDSTAGLLASFIASYAEAEYRSVIYPDKKIMGGQGKTTRLTHYDPTSIWEYAWKVVVAAIAVVLCVFVPALGGVLLMVVISAIITTATSAYAVYMHITEVAPAYNRLWARQYAHLPLADQFQRMATNTALQLSTGDPETVPDFKDYDMDGFFLGDGNPYAADRTTSRMAVVLTEGDNPEIPYEEVEKMETAMQRLAALMFSPDAMDNPDPGGSGMIYIFQEYLKDDFTSFFSRERGLFDHDGLKGEIDYYPEGGFDPNHSSAECAADNRCNPNCLPPGSRERLNIEHGSFDLCPGWQATESCHPDRPWCLAGDPLYENPDNTFRSIREILGHDDENQFLYGIADMGQQIQGIVNFDDPYFSMQGATGIFRVFWKKYLMDLSNTECHWKTPDHPDCDKGQGQWQWKSVGAGGVIIGEGGIGIPGVHPYIPPNIDCDTYPGLCTVDDMLDALEQPAHLMDDMPSSEDMCFYLPDPGEEDDLPEGAEFFLWKPGSHRYQAQDGSPKPPYDKAMGKDCAATDSLCEPNCQTIELAPEGQYCQHYDCLTLQDFDDEGDPDPIPFPDGCNKAEFRDDAFSELLHGSYGVDQFIQEAYQMLQVPPYALLRSVTIWYPTFRRWETEGHLDRWISLIDQWIASYGNFEIFDEDEDDNPPRFCTFDPDNSFQFKVTHIIDCLEAKQQTYAKCLTHGCNVDVLSACQEALGDFQEFLGEDWDDFEFQKVIGDALCSQDEVFLSTVYRYHEMFRHRKEFLENYRDLKNEVRFSGLVQLKDVAVKAKGLINGILKNSYEFMQGGEWSIRDRVIYAWQEWPDGPQEPGLWRVVRVDTRLPTRCSNKCYRPSTIRPPGATLSLNPSNQEPGLPVIERWERRGNAYFSIVDFVGRGYCTGDLFRTIEKGEQGKYGLAWWDTKYCQRRRNCNKRRSCCADWMLRSARTCFQGGMTAARIQRWEEPRKGGVFAWATQIEFWRQIFQRPGVSFVESAIEAKCGEVIDPLYNAFIMTKKEQNENCWNHLNALLSTGIERTACADYYYREAWGNVDLDEAKRTSQFGVRFAPCHAGILSTFTAD